MENICQVCKDPAEKRCSVCKAVFYCSITHQKQHWPIHKQECGKPQQKHQELAKVPQGSQIDQDNLKLDESVGTFRWNNDTVLLNAPTWEPQMRNILLSMEKGW